MSSDLPIDIHCSKLLEWLQSRRHCGKDWQNAALQIREKIAHAIQDMPEHAEILQMLAGAFINYFHCLRIVEILKETDQISKNIFGRYSSQRVKDWQEIVQLYEKNNVYLAESAQLLQQYAQYEIPALKKRLAKCQTVEQECERKQVEYEKLSKEFEKKFRQDCQKMGVDERKNLKAELLKLADCLPEKFEKILENLRGLRQSVDYYENFRNFALFGKNYEKSNKFDDNAENLAAENFLKNLKFILNRGNVTVFEWKNGFAPNSVERNVIRDIFENKDDAENDDIDFGDGDEIDSGAIVDDQNSAPIADFIIENVETGLSAESIDNNGREPTISSTNRDEDRKIDKIARFDDALTLLESSEFLKALNCDLKELQAFLIIRQMELKRSGTADSHGNIDLFDLNETPDEIDLRKSTVDRLLIDLYKDENLKNLRKLRVSPTYLEKLTEILSESRRKSQKFAQLIILSHEQAEESRKTSIDTRKQIDLLIIRAKELQKRIEADISKRYQDRPVNIIGSTLVV